MANQTKRVNATQQVTSMLATEYIILCDSNGKTERILLSDFKASLLGANVDMNAMYDGVFIMSHRKSDNYPLAWKPEYWTAQQNSGEIADGVLLVEGDIRLVIAPTEASETLYWSSSNASGGAVTTSDRVTASKDFAGKTNTTAILSHFPDDGASYAPGFCNAYSRVNANGYGLTAGKWWLPSLGELFAMYANMNKINYALSLIEGATQLQRAGYWSSTEGSANNAWSLYFNDGYQGSGSKSASKYRVRPVSAFIS